MTRGTLIKMAGAAFGGGATWLHHHVTQGNINPGGSHKYDRAFSLGPVENYGSAEKYWDDLCTQPNGHFPMTRIDGIPAKGALLGLRFAYEKPNFVRVEVGSERNGLPLR